MSDNDGEITIADARGQTLTVPSPLLGAQRPRARADPRAAHVRPRKYRESPSAADRRQLRTLYASSQIEPVRPGGSGRSGYPLGITPAATAILDAVD